MASLAIAALSLILAATVGAGLEAIVRTRATVDFTIHYALVGLDGGHVSSRVWASLADQAERSWYRRGDARWVDHMVGDYFVPNAWYEELHPTRRSVRTGTRLNGVRLGADCNEVRSVLGDPAQWSPEPSFAASALPEGCRFAVYGGTVEVAGLSGPEVIVAFREEKVAAVWGTRLERPSGPAVASGLPIEQLYRVLGRPDWVDYVDSFGYAEHFARGARFESLQLTAEVYRGQVGLFQLAGEQFYYPSQP
ncbi:MAG: hypothetical protein AB7J86_08975 [Vulcanimicrobiota bacterium]